MALWPALSLATVGVAITTGLTGLAAAWLFDLNLMQGMLIGAIVGSTDAAAVFSLLGGRSLNERVSATLEIESGSNDPMAVFLTVTLIEVLASAQQDLNAGFAAATAQAVRAGRRHRPWRRLAAVEAHQQRQAGPGLYPLLTVSGGLLIFALTTAVGGSGILAIYLTGLLLGSLSLRSRSTTLSVLDGLTWLSQIGMFLVLGLLASPQAAAHRPAGAGAGHVDDPVRPPHLGLDRAAAVQELRPRERWFISWVGLRGAVPIILAVFPMMAGLPNAQLYFNVAFFVVLVSLILQGSSLPLASRLARVEVPAPPHPSTAPGSRSISTQWGDLRLSLERREVVHRLAAAGSAHARGTRICALFRDQELLHPRAVPVCNPMTSSASSATSATCPPSASCSARRRSRIWARASSATSCWRHCQPGGSRPCTGWM